MRTQFPSATIKASPAHQFKAAPKVFVTAHLDGKASGIASPVLKGADSFERAHEEAPNLLKGTIQASRRPRWLDFSMGAAGLAAGLLPSAFMAASVGSLGGALVAGAIFAYSLPVVKMMAGPLLTALRAPELNGNTDLQLGEAPKATPETSRSTQRLRKNLEQAKTRYPSSRHVVYLSGHGGDGKTLAGLKLPDLREDMSGKKADITVLDTCTSSSLEVMSNLAPWAGLTIASSHPVLAAGYRIEDMFSAEILNQKDTKTTAVEMAKATTPWVWSMNVIDTEAVSSKLLPSLDKLGEELQKELAGPNARNVRRAFRRTKSAGIFPSKKRKYLSNFLEKLDSSKLGESAEKAVDAAKESLQAATVHQRNHRGMTFSKKGDQSLPEGWREFLKEL